MKESFALLKRPLSARRFPSARSKLWLIALLSALCMVLAAKAQNLVYDNLSTAPTRGFGDLNANNLIIGDSLNLTQGGHLSALGLTLFNPNDVDNLGTVLFTGTMVVKFYDNTVPYVGGVLNNPLLGSATLTWDFTGFGGLHPGQFSPNYYNLTSLNIILPQHILITQQFTETSGTSIRNGAALYGNPTIGSSPDNIYIKASDINEGLYPVGGFAAQFGYQIQIVPEPTALAIASLGASGLLVFRRRR
jgi:hypothetical protein